jgi:hypothetical protein
VEHLFFFSVEPKDQMSEAGEPKDELGSDVFKAAIDFIRRTGATQIQIRYSDDEQPVIWFVVAMFGDRFQVAASSTPQEAILHLCEDLTDGGICAHCHRRAGFEPKLLVRMPFDDVICWYQYDPELKTFRRGCE